MYDVMSQFEMTNLITVVSRLLLSAVLGAAIGVDRVKKRRPAGIKTHALVCMGAALIMLTGEYLWIRSSMVTDITRMASQVVSGVGFLGAGSIIVTGRNQIKGLTTAAGLWFAACLGIAIGCGFYVAALFSCFMVFLIVTVFSRLDIYLQSQSFVMDIYIEFDASLSTAKLMLLMKRLGCTIIEMENGHDIVNHSGENHLNALITLQIPKGKSHRAILDELSKIEGIVLVDDF